MSWDPLTGLITYDPGAEVKDLPAGEVHTVTFTYQVTADWGFSSSATVTLDITKLEERELVIKAAREAFDAIKKEGIGVSTGGGGR